MSQETVQVNLKQPSAASLLIFSMNGILVYQTENKTSQTQHVFNIEGLQPGTYIVKVLTVSGEFTGRLLIK
jgi:hypothetical protein